MKFNGIRAVVTDVAEDGGFYFRNQVALMPCIRSGIAASLAGHLWDPGATLLCGYSDFDTQIEHQKIDTRQLDGLSEFYKKAAAECSRIDLCIHCLAVLPDRRAPTSLVHSCSNLGNGGNYPSRFEPDHLCRRLLWLFRQLLSSNFPWPSGSALCQDDIVEFS